MSTELNIVQTSLLLTVMKTVILVLTVIAFINAEDVVQQNQRTDNDAFIRQLIEMIKYFINNGSPDNSFPIMDPFEFNDRYFEFNLPNKLLSLQVGFHTGMVTGLGNFDAQTAKFIEDDSAIELCINFPLITIESESYEMKGHIGEILPIGGKGKFEFEIHNFTVSGKVYLKQSDDGRSILIENILNSQFIIQQVVSRVDFDKNIDEIANTIITELLANYLNRFNQFIVKTYMKTLIDFINQFLNKLRSLS